jgi:signal transduction histidine kinase
VRPRAPQPDLLRWLWHDPLLRSVVVACGLLLGTQLVLIILHPPWIDSITDWFLTVLAWPEAAVVVYFTRRLSQARWPGALSRWLLSTGMVCYAVARTAWTLDEHVILHGNLPFPSVPDLMFALQYPCFFLAVIFIPRKRLASPRLLVLVDSLLWIGTITALSWYFILAPIFIESGLSPLVRAVALTYPVGGLLVLFGLIMILLRPNRYYISRQVLSLFLAGIVCLIIGDSLAAWLVLHPNQVLRRGSLPGLFWMACYMLIALAALVQVRLAIGAPRMSSTVLVRVNYSRQDIAASLRFLAPFLSAVLASAAILTHAALTTARSGWGDLLGPVLVSVGLLLLVIMRQALTFLENRRLQRETEEARASERVQRELNQRKDEFLSIVGHELKTPLTSLRGFVQLLAKRLRGWQPAAGTDESLLRTVELARRSVSTVEGSVRRLSQLVDDLLDDARIQAGRLTFDLERCDLGAIVAAAVEDQRILEPTRKLRLELPSPAVPVMVNVDASRIGQAVTNYLTNALKYSAEDQPITVRLEVVDSAEEGVGAVARVSVHDAGIGVPVGARAQVWKRFERIDGSAVQSGSGVGLGIGLSITRDIIERHHGQVGVESIPGQGSTFWFTLPLALAASATPRLE